MNKEGLKLPNHFFLGRIEEMIKVGNGRNRGFTLTELLVVLAVITALAFISTPIIMRQVEKGRDSRALQAMRDLDTALGLYLDDNNGLFPVSGSTPKNDDILDTADGAGSESLYVLNILLGKSSGVDNLREKNYFDARSDTLRSGYGLQYDNSNNLTGFVDPWNRGYKMILDYDNDEEIDTGTFIKPFKTKLEEKTVRKRYAFFSLGSVVFTDDQGEVSHPKALTNW